MPSPTTTELRVTGMTCNNCARKVTDAAQKVTGVHSASVNLQTAHASVRWNADADKNVATIIRSISQAGYDAAEISPSDKPTRNRWQWNLIVGLGITGGLMAGEWIFGLGTTSWFRWLAFALAAVVQIFCGAQFYSGAWRQLKAGGSNMDTLVALGSTTAFGYSAWAMLTGAGGHVYFMEAAAIISLISFGHWLEACVSEKAGGALKSLLNLAPQTAQKIIKASRDRREETPTQPFSLRSSKFETNQSFLKPPAIEEIQVAVSELRANDHVALRPGDRVPVDGTVLEGESAVDEAMLTGESTPVDKQPGSELFAGTVNLNGRLVMRVTATGEETALAHITAAVQRAQSSHANIQRLGDRVSNIFVPVIVAAALAAGLWWGLAPDSASHAHEFFARFFWHSHAPAGAAAGFIVAAAVLIISCPCAMGLATPVAIMAAANTAARRGFLIRDGVALEKAGNITAVVFDKTGTLTEGKPKLAAAKFFPIELPHELKPFKIEELAASLAALSNHPLSNALATSNPARHPIKDFKELSGRGITGFFPADCESRHQFQLGSLHWLSGEGVDCEEASFFA
ncbi:MAG TPA: cation-translocating P-type ATPase, partial [Verrucomicrobiae bacterium]|nr:cation-translocating P-type ATPase [Verrucomicrobiae bacterium]